MPSGQSRYGAPSSSGLLSPPPGLIPQPLFFMGVVVAIVDLAVPSGEESDHGRGGEMGVGGERGGWLLPLSRPDALSHILRVGAGAGCGCGHFYDALSLGIYIISGGDRDENDDIPSR